MAESNASIGVRYKRHFTIKENGVVMVVGEMKALFVQNNIIQENGEINFNRSNSVGVAGNNTYYKLSQIASLKYFNSDQKDQLKQNIDKEFHQNISETK